MRRFLPIIIGVATLLFGGFYMASASGCTPFLTVQGGTGGCTWISSNLLYGNGTGALQTVATTSISAGTGVSFTTFTAIGTSPVTITASGAFPFTPLLNYGTQSQATTGIPWFQNGIQASSTSHLVNFDFLSATGSTLSVSNPFLVANGTATSSINETATSSFAAGISATYLNLTGVSSATSTSNNGFDLSGGCYSIGGTCLQSIISSASAYKQAVKYASTSTLPSNTYNNGVSGVGATITGVGNGPLFIDGNTTVLGDRILVKNEGTGANNGIYTVTTLGVAGLSAFVLTRATDYNSNLDVYPGVASFVNSGTTNANTCWILTNTTSVTIGTTALTYDDACGAGSFAATWPIQLSGTTFSFGGISTSSAIAAGANVLFATGVNTFASAATGTLTGTGGVSVTAGTSIIGANAQVSCASCALFGYDWLPVTNYAVNMNSTTTPIFLKGAVGGVYSLAASNTAAFDSIVVGSSTTSTLGTSTIFGNLAIRGVASTSILTAVTASTSNLFGADLSSCNSASSALTWSSGLFGCNTISSSGATGQSWEVDSKGQLAPTTTIAVSIPTWLSINDQTLAYASSTNHVTLFGLSAGSNAATTSATDTHNSAFGFNALAVNGGGSRNTAIGYNTLSLNVSANDNTAVGDNALGNNNGSTSHRNTAVGSGALSSLTGAGVINNTAVGYDALNKTTTGTGNVAIGQAVLDSNLTGSSNVFIGNGAGQNNDAPTSTVAIGVSAGSNAVTKFASQHSVFIGGFSGDALSSGSDDNTIIGYTSGGSLTSGYGNVLVGISSGSGNTPTTGNNNIGIGPYVWFNSATANSQLNIGNALFGTLPATSTAFQTPAAGNIGIGTTSPYARLTIESTASATVPILFALSSSTNSGGVFSTSTLFTVNNLGSTTLFETPSTILSTNAGGTIIGTGIGTGLTFSSNALSNTGVISLTNGTGINCSGTNPGSCSIAAPVSYANGGTGTTTAVQGQLRYMGATADQGVATSSLSASSPLTGSFTVIGSGGSVGCQAASGAQAGCLSSSDWTTFNTKIGWGQATSTSINQFVYTNNNGLLVSAASSSLNLPNAALTNSTISGVALGSSLNSLTINNGGAGAASGATYNGSSGVTISYNTIGAQVAGTYDTFAWPWNTTSTFGTTTSATTTPAWFQTGLYASSTSWLTTIQAGNITASSTASSTNTIVSSLTSGSLAGVTTAGQLTNITANTGLQVSGSNLNNTGVISGSCTGGTTCSGTNPLAINSFSYPFTLGTNYGVAASMSTGTLTAFTVGVVASSTSYFNTISALTSSTTNASTTNLSAWTLAVGGASSSTIDNAGLIRAKNLTLFAITGTANNCLQVDTNGVVSGTGALCGGGSGIGIGDPFTHSANFGTTLASATTTPLWTQNYLFASSTAYMGTAFHASSTAPQLYLSDTFNSSMWFMRGIAGNLFIGTSTTLSQPFATSTYPVLEITSGGLFGIGTTSPWARLTLDRFGQTNNAYASSSILVTEWAIATTTNKTIDARDSNNQLFQIGGSATTINLTGFVAGSNMTLEVCNPSGTNGVSTAGAITWATTPANLLDWTNSSTSPQQTLTANKCDLYHFYGTAATTSNGLAAAGIGLGKIFAWQIPNF